MDDQPPRLGRARLALIWPRRFGRTVIYEALEAAYEAGRQDFAQEALDDLAARGFSIALWQSHTRRDIRRWIEGLRARTKWSDT
ncbi:hypothetical protein JNUCC0626_18475 [Lentzea sp. JNUCC 0626]|uniref:hypothetical protein n=1 Tax=Lentzea sp. JNUCC 0626 TaxID=3367513 RepID=UPI003748434C